MLKQNAKENSLKKKIEDVCVCVLKTSCKWKQNEKQQQKIKEIKHKENIFTSQTVVETEMCDSR